MVEKGPARSPVPDLTREKDQDDKKDSEELVDSSTTNPLSISISIMELIEDISTNYYPSARESLEQLVDRLSTIYFRGTSARRVISWAHSNRVFLVATMAYDLRIEPNTIYGILRKLNPWVLKTDKTIISPNPSTRGPYPHLWKVAGEVLLDGIGEARRAYNATLTQTDPAKKIQERDKARREGLVSQVIEALGTPPTGLTPVYETMRSLGVSQSNPDWLYVKNEVLRWVQEGRE